MSRRAFLLLCLITFIVAAAAIGMTIYTQVRDNRVALGGGPMFAEFVARANDVAQLMIATDRYTMTLEKRGDQWVALEHGDYPAQTQPVAEVIAALATMTKVDPKTENPDWYDFLAVGAPAEDNTNPGFRISAATANGDVLADAIFGIRSTTIGYTRVGGTFVRPTNEAQAWLVEGQMNVPAFVQDWFGQIVHIPGPEVARIQILEAGRLTFDASKVDFTTGQYQITYLDPTAGPPLSTPNNDGIRSITQAIVSTSFDGARPVDSVTFGPTARMVRFTTRDGLVLEVALADADGEVWVTYKASAPEGTPAAETAAGITERTSRWAFKLPAYRVAALSRPYADLFIPPPAPPAQPLGGDPNRALVPALPLRQ